MQRKMIGILSLLFTLFLFAGLASAVTLNQCPAPDGTTEFVLVGDDNIIFEAQQANSGRVINGNVLVTSRHPLNGTFNNTGSGFVKVGANTNIQGTVIADVIILPDAGATITSCVANTLIANTAKAQAVCGPWPCAANVHTCVVPGAPFSAFATANPTCADPVVGPPITFSSLCGPTPVVDNCTVGKPAINVPVNPPSPPLAAGCYGALTLEAGAVLQLGPGTFTFASVHMKAGARLTGGPSTVNVNGLFLADAGSFLTDITLSVAQKTATEIVQIFNNSVLTNVVINAPFGKCHLHTGTDLACSEACCQILDVEPITAECGAPGFVCACKQGFKFVLNPQDPVAGQSPADVRARDCEPCGPNDHPSNGFPTCNP